MENQEPVVQDPFESNGKLSENGLEGRKLNLDFLGCFSVRRESPVRLSRYSNDLIGFPLKGLRRHPALQQLPLSLPLKRVRVCNCWFSVENFGLVWSLLKAKNCSRNLLSVALWKRSQPVLGPTSRVVEGPQGVGVLRWRVLGCVMTLKAFKRVREVKPTSNKPPGTVNFSY